MSSRRDRERREARRAAREAITAPVKQYIATKKRDAALASIKKRTETFRAQQRQAEQEAGLTPRYDPPGYGSNRWGGYEGDGGPSSLSDMKGGLTDPYLTNRPPAKEPEPAPQEPDKASRRSVARGSTLSLAKDGRSLQRGTREGPAKRTAPDPSPKRQSPTDKNNVGDASRRGRLAPKSAATRGSDQRDAAAKTEPRSSDHRDAAKEEHPHCKPRPKDNKPKGAGGSGKEFVPWC